MSAARAIERLLANHPKGFDLSLERVTGLLEALGDPHLKIPPVFHIAGTNGKGSTAAFLRALVEAAGKTVHVHTSPHLVNWHERYRIGKKGGGKFVTDKVLERAVLAAEKANQGRAITVFEIMSAVAFLLFSQKKADYAIMEVGLGGRFDATNVLEKPAISIITPIGLDHEAYLGDTLEKIAFEKAGIIKPGVPVVIGLQDEAVLEVLCDAAAQKNAPTIIARQDFDFYVEGGRLIFTDENGLLDLSLPSLAGVHQLENAGLAIAAARAVLPGLSFEVCDRAMRQTVWPGRFEKLKPGKLTKTLSEPALKNLHIWLDGGHNPHAGRALAAQLKKLIAQSASTVPVVMIAGMLTTKDPTGFFCRICRIGRPNSDCSGR